MVSPARGVSIALILISVGLAGCLGGSGSVDTGPVTQPPEETGDATVYVPSADGGSRVLFDATELLDGVPLPDGVARYTDGRSFEPTIGVTSSGAIFFSSFHERGQVELGDYQSVRRSTDEGLTWEDVTPEIGPTTAPPQSNDPYLHVDPTTDRIFDLNMQGLQCHWLSMSDDDGDTWQFNPLACGQPPLLDHPTLFTGPPTVAADEARLDAAGYPNVVYLCVNRVADSACARSLDGGLSFGPFRPLVYPGVDPNVDEPGFLGVDGFCGGLHGHGVTGPDGTVYLPKGHCNLPTVAISHDDGLTWERVVISESTQTYPFHHDVDLATDPSGNVYATWIGGDQAPHLAVSTDQGQTWTDPIVVAPPSLGGTGFPAVTAGEDGRVAISYIGTTSDKAYNELDGNDTWNAYLTVIPDALSDTPTIATTQINDDTDPIAKGVCWPTRCDGMGDFMDVTIGPDGRPWAAFVDVCDEDCIDGDSNHGVNAFAGTLAEGPRLVGEVGPLAPLETP